MLSSQVITILKRKESFIEEIHFFYLFFFFLFFSFFSPTVCLFLSLSLKKYHLCLSVLSKMKARPPDKLMDVTSDVKVTDESDFLSHSMMIKAKAIMKERIWITVKLTIQNRVAKVDDEPNATSWTYSRGSRLHVRMSKKSG